MAVLTPRPEDAFLIVDVQNDFCTGGALAVPGGEGVVPVVNSLIPRFPHILVTQDWHTEDHISFASRHPGRRPYETIPLAYGEQILWPDHCVQGTRGALFHPGLDARRAELIVRKGHHREIDSYSAFFENDRVTPTGMGGYLRERGFRRLFLAGLATDFCVHSSAMDARRLGFEAVVIEDACRGIDLAGSLDAAWSAMTAAGVARARSGDIVAGK